MNLQELKAIGLTDDQAYSIIGEMDHIKTENRRLKEVEAQNSHLNKELNKLKSASSAANEANEARNKANNKLNNINTTNSYDRQAARQKIMAIPDAIERQEMIHQNRELFR